MKVELKEWKTIEMGHNSHYHTYTLDVSDTTHQHSSTSSTDACPNSGGATHNHGFSTTLTDSHHHTITGQTNVVSATSLTHTHTFSGTSGSGGTYHSHDGGSSGLGGCQKGYPPLINMCGNGDNRHSHSGSGNSANGGASHTHSYSGTTGNGSGTLYAHTHSMSGSLDYGNSHGHAAGSLALTTALCMYSGSHGHNGQTCQDVSHTHTISGNTDSAGEPLPASFGSPVL